MIRALLVAPLLVAVGLPLSWSAIRSWPSALATAPLAAAGVLALSAMGSVLTSSAFAPWLVACILLSWVAAWLISRRDVGPLPMQITWSGLAIIVALTAVPLLGIVRDPSFWDARSIWAFHAEWLLEGGAAARSAIANSVYAFSHNDYPPLVSAATAGVWWLLSSDHLKLAQVSTSVLTYSAVLTLSVAAHNVFREQLGRYTPVLGGFLGLSAYALSIDQGTTGHADLLVSALVGAGALLLLIAPEDRWVITGSLLVALATLTKNEGLVWGAAVALLSIARHRNRRAIIGTVVALVPGVAWVAMSRAIGASSDLLAEGGLTRVTSAPTAVLDRAVAALPLLSSFAATSIVLALVVSATGYFLLKEPYERSGLGSTGWMWVGSAAAFAFLLIVYSISPHDLQWHIFSSIQRVVIGPKLLLLLIVTAWTAVAIATLGDLHPTPGSTSRGDVGES